MEIHRDTRIAELISHDERSIETLVSVSSRFKKLRNPMIRKVMAGQVSIAMAARVGGVAEQAIFDALASIGFQCNSVGSPEGSGFTNKAAPDLAHDHVDSEAAGKSEKEFKFKTEFHSAPGRIVDLDVRPIMDRGEEPLSAILKAAETVGVDERLRIINSFAPEPLIGLLGKKGFEGYIYSAKDCFHACFIRRSMQAVSKPDPISERQTDPNPMVTETGLHTTGGGRRAVVRLDVRGMTPPGPMVKILKTLQSLSSTQQLYVFHERIPRFLFPQLAEQGYAYRTSEQGGTDVRLLIGRRP